MTRTQSNRKRHPPTERPGNRCAIYLRRSKSDEEGSIPVQDASCRAYAAAQGWLVAAVETDMESAYRAGSEDRAGYQRVIELARAGAIDHVIVWKWSRFGRDAGETLSRHRELGRLGVRLHSPTEDLDNPLLAGVLAVIAENESRELSARVAPAKRRLAAQGKHLGANLPFGTVRNAAKQLEPGPDFALVRLMFELAADGIGVSGIAAALSDRLGRRVHPTLPSRVLRNVVYRGTLRATLPDGRPGHVPDAWPAMIPAALWDAAQVTLARRTLVRDRRGAAARYWVSGLVWCGECGRRAGVHDGRRRIATGYRQYEYIVCHHQCRGVHDSPAALQAWVRAELAGALLAPAAIPALRAALTDYLSGHRDTAALRRRELTAQRAEAVIRRDRAELGYLDGLYGAERAIALKGDADLRIARIDAEAALLPVAPAIDADRLVSLLTTSDWHDLADTAPARYTAILTELIDGVDVFRRPGRGQPPPRRVRYRAIVAELLAGVS